MNAAKLREYQGLKRLRNTGLVLSEWVVIGLYIGHLTLSSLLIISMILTTL